MTAPRSRKFFGTDGIRAVAGESPLDPTPSIAVGLALGHSLRSDRAARQPAVLLGRDTRESSPWIAATLAAGLRAAGATVESAGIVPTPAVAFLARTHGFQAGVVISASHNPWRDNGIKLFGADGFKLADSLELAMEDEILHHAAQHSRPPDPARSHPVEDNAALQADYIQFLIDCVPGLSLVRHAHRCRLRQRRRRRHRSRTLRSTQSDRPRSHAAQHRAQRPQHQRRLRRASSRTRRR